MNVWLASYPRSGNTLVRMLLDRVYGIPSYAGYEEKAPVTHAPRPEFQMWVSPMPETPGPGKPDGPDSLRFIKTHGPPADDAPAVCIVRDGRDALVSYAHYLRCFDPAASGQPFGEVLSELISATDVHCNWSLCVNAWRARGGSAPTAWLRYEALVEDPTAAVAGCLARLGLDLKPTGGALPDFAELHRAWPAFFRKGKCGAWREEMSDELHRLFWRRHGAMMEEFGYRDGRPAPYDGGEARRTLINTLQTALLASEADRAARGRLIGRMEAALQASEADRAARLDVIRRLDAALQTSEADRAARLEVIQALEAALKVSEADRADRLEVIRRLDAALLAAASNPRPSLIRRILGWRAA